MVLLFTSIHNPCTWGCQRFLFNLNLHFQYKASNKCYFHAKLFLFSVTSLICVRGLLSSVMPRAIFHLTEEAKSQDAIVHNGPQQPILFKNWLELSNDVMYEPVWCDKPYLWAGAPFIYHDWGSEVPISNCTLWNVALIHFYFDILQGCSRGFKIGGAQL